MVDVTNSYKQEELIPYKKLIASGYQDMVMTAHIVNSNVDKDFPATLSPLFLQNILRAELGYKGVIVSDDMQMGAIIDNYGFEEAIIKAVLAGCDILIVSNNNKQPYDEKMVYRAVNAVYESVLKGEISEEKITASYNRIISLKQKYNIK